MDQATRFFRIFDSDCIWPVWLMMLSLLIPSQGFADAKPLTPVFEAPTPLFNLTLNPKTGSTLSPAIIGQEIPVTAGRSAPRGPETSLMQFGGGMVYSRADHWKLSLVWKAEMPKGEELELFTGHDMRVLSPSLQMGLRYKF
jgi:hypothetical protein